MSATLFKRSLRSAAAVMAAIVVVLAFYIAMVAYLYDPEVSESIQLMQAAMPELFEAFGMANPSATLLDFLLNYLYGFLFTGTLVLMAAYLAQRLVVGPVRDGSLAWLLAAPRSRLSLALTFVAVEVAAVAIVVGLSWGAEVIACEALFPGELDGATLARANAGLVALGLFVAALCFASACCFQHTGLALWGGAGACAVFLLMGTAGAVGKGLAWVADLSPLALYDAYGLAAADGGAVAGAIVLAAAAAALFALGVARFCRRDFSL